MFIKSFDKTIIYYQYSKKAGNKPTLVFIHGWVNNWSTWKKEIDYFKRKGYSTLYLDLRGHGKSGKPEKVKDYKLEAFAKDINFIIKKEKIKKFALIGHSMGGMIALAYYKLFAKTLKPKALVLCDTTYHDILKNNIFEPISPIINLLASFIAKNSKIRKKNFCNLKDFDLNNCKNKSDIIYFCNCLRETPLKSVFSSLGTMMNFDYKSVLKKIDIPTLILEGKEDKERPFIDSLELHYIIKNSTLISIPKAGHFINVEKPSVVSKKISHFLLKNKI